jgi:hypothetical protein
VLELVIFFDIFLCCFILFDILFSFRVLLKGLVGVGGYCIIMVV